MKNFGSLLLGSFIGAAAITAWGVYLYKKEQKEKEEELSTNDLESTWRDIDETLDSITRTMQGMNDDLDRSIHEMEQKLLEKGWTQEQIDALKAGNMEEYN